MAPDKHVGKQQAAAIKPAVDQFHQMLGKANLGHLRVHSLTLMPAAQQPEGDSHCGPGYTWVCEPLPGGGLNCYCKPDNQP